MRSNYLAALIVIAAVQSYASGQATFLYNGSAGDGSQTPQSQDWLFPETAGAVTSSSGGATSFDTTSDASIKAGYAYYPPLLGPPENSALPPFNSSVGFTVSFDVQITNEVHGANTNRAGFDVIVLDKNAMGIELGFWADDIWAQNDSPLFTHGEDDQFNTESSSNHYDLTLYNGNYDLFANGTSILTGAMRNYSAEGAPYTLDNYIFIGDDTTEASASESFSTLSVTVPEPAAMTMAAAVFFAAIFARRGRRSAAAGE